MKVNCLQENIAKGLATVSRAISERGTLPATRHVLLASDNGRLKLTATNLETSITCWVGAQIEEEGSACVPGRLLTDLVSALPREKVEMVLAGKTLRVICGRDKANMAGMDARDFPPIPAVDGGISFAIDSRDLGTAIKQVEFAASSDDVRLVLTGIHWLAEGRVLKLATADGNRLAVRSLALSDDLPERLEAIIPVAAMRELQRLLPAEGDVDVVFNATRSMVRFHVGDAELISSLIQGTFPNYAQFIPQSFPAKATLDLAAFEREVRTANIFGREGKGKGEVAIVRLAMTSIENGTPGTLAVSARGGEVGDHDGEMDAVIVGEPSKIALSNTYLQDVLGVLGTERLTLEASTPSSPVLIRAEGCEDYLYLVMPIFVQW